MSKIRLYFLHFLKKNKNNSTQKKRNYSYYNDIFFNYSNNNNIETIEDRIGLDQKDWSYAYFCALDLTVFLLEGRVKVAVGEYTLWVGILGIGRGLLAGCCIVYLNLGIFGIEYTLRVCIFFVSHGSFFFSRNARISRNLRFACLPDLNFLPQIF